jgi:cobalt transport protein ATP-binding subunit
MTPALEVRDLHYRYPDGKEALRGVTFAVQEGECLGLVGPNGAGKSTLLLHLNGLLPETDRAEPAVLVRGLPVTRARAHEIHRRVGLLFQDPDDQLFCPTVMEDVAFGPSQLGLSDGEVRALVTKALHTVGLDGFERRPPHHLSGGEKRRVCLAGVLACQPEILVLDEPTSDLDPRARRELKELLGGLPATRIIATHDLELVVELCTRVILIDEGRVAAEGTALTLLGDEPLMLAHGLEKPHILRHRHPHG